MSKQSDKKYKKTSLHWLLAKFLKDSLIFLSDNPRGKGMKRMDWVNEWIETEYENFLLVLPYLLQEDD